MALVDQWGHASIPNDLVTLPNPNMLTTDETYVVMQADWYEVNGVLLASAVAINYLSEDDPIDSGVDLSQSQVVTYVAHDLKRVEEDGFYHA